MRVEKFTRWKIFKNFFVVPNELKSPKNQHVFFIFFENPLRGGGWVGQLLNGLIHYFFFLNPSLRQWSFYLFFCKYITLYLYSTDWINCDLGKMLCYGYYSKCIKIIWVFWVLFFRSLFLEQGEKNLFFLDHRLGKGKFSWRFSSVWQLIDSRRAIFI